jgi:DNA-binding winged helix-turn-helix (wHTH) protein
MRQFKFPPFILDTVEQCVWRHEGSQSQERLSLPPKAFAVLQFLVERPGHLVSQDEIIDAVWPSACVQPEVLKSQILDVRRALGDSARRPRFIETLHRRGYRFIAPVDKGLTQETPECRPARLVGRDAELKALREHLHKSLIGQRQFVFFTGEVGIGKTTVLDEFQRQAALAVPDIRIAREQCFESFGGKQPFHSMLSALDQLLRGPDHNEIAHIILSQAPTWAGQFPALLTRERRASAAPVSRPATLGEGILREILEALTSISASRPLLLIFEDLQWVDHDTVDLLSALARHRTSGQLMLIATFRPTDLTKDIHPLKALVPDLLLHRLCQEIALQPLTECDVTTYLKLRCAAADPPQGLATLLHRHSGGNPLFMVAALEHLTRRGLLSQENDRWNLTVPLADIEVGVPDTIREMIEAGIARLSLEEQQALEIASAVGVVFSAEICATLSRTDPNELDDLFDALARRQQIIRRALRHPSTGAGSSETYEFAHALYREVLYQGIPRNRRARLERNRSEHPAHAFLTSSLCGVRSRHHHARHAERDDRQVNGNSGRTRERHRPDAWPGASQQDGQLVPDPCLLAVAGDAQFFIQQSRSVDDSPDARNAHREHATDTGKRKSGC